MCAVCFVPSCSHAIPHQTRLPPEAHDAACGPRHPCLSSNQRQAMPSLQYQSTFFVQPAMSDKLRQQQRSVVPVLSGCPGSSSWRKVMLDQQRHVATWRCCSYMFSASTSAKFTDRPLKSYRISNPQLDDMYLGPECLVVTQAALLNHASNTSCGQAVLAPGPDTTQLRWGVDIRLAGRPQNGCMLATRDCQRLPPAALPLLLVQKPVA